MLRHGSAVAATVCLLLIAAAAPARASVATATLPASDVAGFAVPADEIFAIAPGPEGEIWFAGSNESGAGEIDRVSPAGVLTGEFLIPVGTEPDMPEFARPVALVAGADGDMWFADDGTNAQGEGHIGRFTPAGRPAEYAIPDGHASGGLNSNPESVALGADGDVWFTTHITGEDGSTAGIDRIDGEGTITPVALPIGVGRTLPERNFPVGVAAGPEGEMWFLEDGTNDEGHPLIGRISLDGAISELPVPGTKEGLWSIVRGAEGDMWFTIGSNKIGRATPNGEITEYPAGNLTGDGIGNLAAGPEGDVWYGEGAGSLGRIDAAGEVTTFSGAASVYYEISTVGFGPEGNLWYGPRGAGYGVSEIDRLTTPVAPQLLAAPTISGQSLEGETLTVSTGSWSGAPTSYSYQWLLCSAAGGDCEDQRGETGASVGVTAGDVGHTLRVVVSATNLGGTTASAVSTDVIQALAPPAPAEQERPLTAAPVPTPALATSVGSEMTWKFAWASHYAIARSLLVRGVPAGAWIAISCHGRGCPIAEARVKSGEAPRRICRARSCPAYPQLRGGEVNLAALFAKRHLPVGSQLVVDVLESGWIGKTFRFTVRENAPPRIDIQCLAVGSQRAIAEC
jgi:streptogramin lyase